MAKETNKKGKKATVLDKTQDLINIQRYMDGGLNPAQATILNNAYRSHPIDSDEQNDPEIEHIAISAVAANLNKERSSEFISKFSAHVNPEAYRRFVLKEWKYIPLEFQYRGPVSVLFDPKPLNVKPDEYYYEKGVKYFRNGDDPTIDSIRDDSDLIFKGYIDHTHALKLWGFNLDQVINGYADASFFEFVEKYTRLEGKDHFIEPGENKMGEAQPTVRTLILKLYYEKERRHISENLMGPLSKTYGHSTPILEKMLKKLKKDNYTYIDNTNSAKAFKECFEYLLQIFQDNNEVAYKNVKQDYDKLKAKYPRLYK